MWDQWQDDVDDPLNPLRLLMAHEEDVYGVRPVASDLDAFLIGSKGMKAGPPIADDQVDLMKCKRAERFTPADHPVWAVVKWQ